MLMKPRLVEQHRVSNVEIRRVSEGEVDEYIAKCKYGFLIREDNTVNNVATPTKMSTYIFSRNYTHHD